MKTIYSLQEILTWAQERSPFYRRLYHQLDLNTLSQLPIVDQEKFWQANSADQKHNTLLTAPLQRGMIFKSGGTTGQPKFSVYTPEEWETFTEEFGGSFQGLGLAPGDRVGNLFYAGNLYASFVFISASLEKSRVPHLHFPMTGQMPIADMVKIIQEFSINVLMGVPTTLLNLLQFIQQHGLKVPLEKIYFGGESLYPDQREWLQQHYPHLLISSIGYASVDAGHLGRATRDCRPGEHFAFSQSTILEIVDEETLRPIDPQDQFRPGKLLVTNLTRKLMPIIRYPVGDRAMWVQGEQGLFQILGRSEEGARIGPVTLNRDDVQFMLRDFAALKSSGQNLLQMQFILERREGKDQLTLKLSCPTSLLESPTARQQVEEEIAFIIYRQRPALTEEMQKGTLWPIRVTLVPEQDLATNTRTGKLKTVLDLRAPCS